MTEEKQKILDEEENTSDYAKLHHMTDKEAEEVEGGVIALPLPWTTPLVKWVIDKFNGK